MDLEQILLAKAASDAEQGPRLSDMTALGAGVGAALGTMSGGVAPVSYTHLTLPTILLV